MSSREGGSLPPDRTDEIEGGPRLRGDSQSVGEAIRAAAEALGGVSDTARLDAEVLMAHALGVSRSDMQLRCLRGPAPEAFAALVARRVGREPVAYITGAAEFYGLTLRVTPATLIPRADSETLVAAALEIAGAQGRALDLGTGSGALLLALLVACPGWRGTGIDASPGALAVAADNAAALGLADRSKWLRRDWRMPGWSEDIGRFDLVLANPPYVEDGATLDPQVRDHEPHSALFAGPEGLDAYRALIPQLGKLLLPGGTAIVEIGAAQAEAVGALAYSCGFRTELHRDLANRPRALVLR